MQAMAPIVLWLSGLRLHRPAAGAACWGRWARDRSPCGDGTRGPLPRRHAPLPAHADLLTGPKHTLEGIGQQGAGDALALNAAADRQTCQHHHGDRIGAYCAGNGLYCRPRPRHRRRGPRRPHRIHGPLQQRLQLLLQVHRGEGGEGIEFHPRIPIAAGGGLVAGGGAGQQLTTGDRDRRSHPTAAPPATSPAGAGCARASWLLRGAGADGS